MTFLKSLHDKLHAWYASTKGWRIYALAAFLALPDMLDALAGIDLTKLLPVELSARAATWLVVARIVLTIYIRRLPPTAPATEAK